MKDPDQLLYNFADNVTASFRDAVFLIKKLYLLAPLIVGLI